QCARRYGQRAVLICYEASILIAMSQLKIPFTSAVVVYFPKDEFRVCKRSVAAILPHAEQREVADIDLVISKRGDEQKSE
ncbi:hypothetical protein PMAYCL1PPCAC_14157, partial [Pristionchus mayeri]